jgi:hypothetical protein
MIAIGAPFCMFGFEPDGVVDGSDPGAYWAYEAAATS